MTNRLLQILICFSLQTWASDAAEKEPEFKPISKKSAGKLLNLIAGEWDSEGYEEKEKKWVSLDYNVCFLSSGGLRTYKEKRPTLLNHKEELILDAIFWDSRVKALRKKTFGFLKGRAPFRSEHFVCLQAGDLHHYIWKSELYSSIEWKYSRNKTHEMIVISLRNLTEHELLNFRPDFKIRLVRELAPDKIDKK